MVELKYFSCVLIGIMYIDFMKEKLVNRLFSKISVKPSGCWIWTASLDGKGYGQININQRPQRAHRETYKLFFGEIPKGLVLDHKCRTKNCVNPFHLEPVTQAENVRRGDAGKYLKVLVELRGNKCKKGHNYEEYPPYTSKRGTIICRRCRADGVAEYKRKKRDNPKAR